MPLPMTKLQRAEREYDEQIEWIAECGGDLEGYVAKYGSKDDPDGYYGDGGEAIYEADVLTLNRIVWRIGELL